MIISKNGKHINLDNILVFREGTSTWGKKKYFEIESPGGLFATTFLITDEDKVKEIQKYLEAKR